MLALPDVAEPFPVRVVAMFKPLVNQHVGRVVVECFAYELAHGERWLRKRRVMLSPSHEMYVIRRVAPDECGDGPDAGP